MSNGPGFTPAVQKAWQQAGQETIAKSGYTWDDILNMIREKQGGSDTELHSIIIPGLGGFSINYGSLGSGPDAPLGVTSIVHEGGAKGGPEDGRYPDTMVGYGPGENGAITPISYGINLSQGALAAYIALVASMGTAAAYLGPGAAASAGVGEAAAPAAAAAAGTYSIPTTAELAANGFMPGMAMTGPGGIAASTIPSITEAGLTGATYGTIGTTGLSGVDQGVNESAKLLGQNSSTEPFFNPNTPYTPTNPGQIPIDSNQNPNEANKLTQQNNAPPGEYNNTTLPTQSTTPGSTPPSGPTMPPGAQQAASKLASYLLSPKPSSGTGLPFDMSGGGGFGGSPNDSQSHTPGLTPAGQPTQPMQQAQQMAQVLLSNPEQPKFNFSDYQQVPDFAAKMAQYLQQQNQG